MSNQPREISPFGFLKDDDDGKNFAPVVMPADLEDEADELDPTQAPLHVEAVELLEGELAGAGGAVSFGHSEPPSKKIEKSGKDLRPARETPSSGTEVVAPPSPPSPPVVATPPIVQTPSSPNEEKTTQQAS
jgi:hypothetical protein